MKRFHYDNRTVARVPVLLIVSIHMHINDVYLFIYSFIYYTNEHTGQIEMMIVELKHTYIYAKTHV